MSSINLPCVGVAVKWSRGNVIIRRAREKISQAFPRYFYRRRRRKPGNEAKRDIQCPAAPASRGTVYPFDVSFSALLVTKLRETSVASVYLYLIYSATGVLIFPCKVLYYVYASIIMVDSVHIVVNIHRRRWLLQMTNV